MPPTRGEGSQPAGQRNLAAVGRRVAQALTGCRGPWRSMVSYLRSLAPTEMIVRSAKDNRGVSLLMEANRFLPHL